jgi:hypothetical protein
MIVMVTEQFNMKPIKSDWRAEIEHATETRPCQVYNFWSGVKEPDLRTGGLIAEWWLDENLRLNLTLNMPTAGANPNEYILTLSSEAPAKLEIETEQRREKEDEMRARTINPSQRF